MPYNKNGIYRCECETLCKKYSELWYGDIWFGYTGSGLGKDIKELLGDRLKSSKDDCIDLWGALANVSWLRPSNDGKGGVSIEEDGFSFRSAGGLISEILEEGCYTDWYCSGITSTVPDWIAESLATRGWTFELCDRVPPVDYRTCNDDYNLLNGWKDEI